MTLTRVLLLKKVDGKKGHDIELRQHESTIQVWWLDENGAWSKHIVFKDDGYVGALKDMYEYWLPAWTWEFVRGHKYRTLKGLLDAFGTNAEV